MGGIFEYFVACGLGSEMRERKIKEKKMGGIFEYFIACGLGLEMRTMDGNKGYHGMRVLYLPFLLDQYPLGNHSLYPPPPTQLPICLLPAGSITLYGESALFPALLGILRTAMEELFALCFSLAGSSKPLWDVISYMVSNVPLPTPGKDLVLFAIENCMLSVEAPPKDGLPHVEISFQPLVQCLDVDNLLKLLTAVLLERRILLCSNKYLSEPCRDNKLFKRRNQI